MAADYQGWWICPVDLVLQREIQTGRRQVKLDLQDDALSGLTAEMSGPGYEASEGDGGSLNI